MEDGFLAAAGGEAEPVEFGPLGIAGEMSDRFVRRARDLTGAFDSGRHDLNCAHVLTFTRVVVEPTVTIEKAFAGRVELA